MKIIYLPQRAIYSIEKKNNSGSASGYNYFITGPIDSNEIISCGDLYWVDEQQTQISYVGPDYDSGTTTCSAIINGEFSTEIFTL